MHKPGHQNKLSMELMLPDRWLVKFSGRNVELCSRQNDSDPIIGERFGNQTCHGFSINFDDVIETYDSDFSRRNELSYGPCESDDDRSEDTVTVPKKENSQDNENELHD